jgi:hypothetical protein
MFRNLPLLRMCNAYERAAAKSPELDFSLVIYSVFKVTEVYWYVLKLV